MKTLLIFLLLAFSAAASAQTTTFTYQGRLTDASVQANGTYDLGFALYDAETGGAQIGAAITRSNVTVSGGVFIVQLDFGANPFAAGASRFLQIAVKRTSETNFTTLTPRQPLTSAPYSIRTLSASISDALSTACAGCVTDAQIDSVAGTKITGTVANATNATSATTAGNVTGTVAVANGGTGSTTQNFVDLTTAQTVAGAKTFSSTVAAPTFNATTGFNIGGNRALSFGAAGSNNLFAGLNAGNTNAANTGILNSFVGTSAGLSNTTGINNAFFGAVAGASNTTGGANSFFGSQAGLRNTTGGNNLFVGTFAGLSNTTGGNNSFVGAGAGQSNTTGGSNSFVGAFAGSNNTTGAGNSFVGGDAGGGNTTGRDNSFVGSFAGRSNTTGDSNSFVGARAGSSNTMGHSNSFVGTGAGGNNTTGAGNSFVGRDAGFNNNTGSNNLFVGSSAGGGNTTGESNTVIGNSAILNANNRIFASAFGANAVATANDTIVIGKVTGNYLVGGVSTVRPADTVQIPGNLVVTGSIQGASKNFVIDHPLDPLNKTLTYTSIESPDMKNIYDGNITTDQTGEATVVMPAYFEALNKDFRYQLTVVGQFAQAIVAKEISGNRFKIRTDKPGVKVSWQVTGIRRDRFAEDQRATVEETKPAAGKGKCLYAPACAAANQNAKP